MNTYEVTFDEFEDFVVEADGFTVDGLSVRFHNIIDGEFVPVGAAAGYRTVADVASLVER